MTADGPLFDEAANGPDETRWYKRAPLRGRLQVARPCANAGQSLRPGGRLQVARHPTGLASADDADPQSDNRIVDGAEV